MVIMTGYRMSNESVVWRHNVYVHEYRYDPLNVSDEIRSCAYITTFSVHTMIAPVRHMCLYGDDAYTLGGWCGRGIKTFRSYLEIAWVFHEYFSR